MKVDLPILSESKIREIVKDTVQKELKFVYEQINKLRNQNIDFNRILSSVIDLGKIK